MDKHLTEIEVFEYANQLISDINYSNTIEQHLKACDQCLNKVEEEQSFAIHIKESIEVTKQVDLSDKIAHYFAQDKPNFIGLDTKGIIYIILGLSALMMLSQVVEIEIKSIQISHLNVIFSSIVGLLFVELVVKYRKYKKGNTAI